MVVEIDGSIHQTEEAKHYDIIRDNFMQSLNIRIVRFTNDEVCNNGELVVDKLKKTIESFV